MKSYFDVSDENSLCNLLNFFPEAIEIMEKDKKDFNEFNESYDSNITIWKERKRKRKSIEIKKIQTVHVIVVVFEKNI